MHPLRILSHSFFERRTLAVAQALLGCYLVHDTPSGRIVGKIVETEAYLHDDPASHSFRGETKRNQSMFSKAGTSYVYFTYGMYHCFNVVTNKEGVGEAVLVRALEPIEGIAHMQKKRDVAVVSKLCNGPAKLVIALGIGREHNGIDLLSPQSNLKLMQGKNKPSEIIATKRICISTGTELPHRFYLKGSEFVSRK